MIIITHANREYYNQHDREHISYFTMVTLARACSSICHQNDVTIVENSSDAADISADIDNAVVFMFLCGTAPTAAARDFAHRAAHLNIILEDANWECDLSWIDREFTIITWSATLCDIAREQDLSRAIAFIKEHAPLWKLPAEHYIASVESLSLIHLITRYDLDMRFLRDALTAVIEQLGITKRRESDFVMPAVSASGYVYAGSAKPERLRDVIARAARDDVSDLCLIGNITAEHVRDLHVNSEDAPLHITYEGRVPFSNVISRLASKSNHAVVYALDEAIAAFKFDTLRKLETALCFLPIVGLDDTGDSMVDDAVRRDVSQMRLCRASLVGLLHANVRDIDTLRYDRDTLETWADTLVHCSMQGSHTRRALNRCLR